MTDIVKRLREGRTDETALRWTVTDIHRDAADEIERLRAEVARCEASILAWVEAVGDCNRDRHRLRAERDAAYKIGRKEALLHALHPEFGSIYDTEGEATVAYKAGRREGIEAAAAETDCGCAARPDVLARLAETDHKRASYLCSHGDACCALHAAAIRALLEDGR